MSYLRHLVPEADQADHTKPMATFCDRSSILSWLILALLSFAGIRPAAAQFPVPRRYDGFLYGTEAKDGIVIEAFLDIL
jgi:hypothetical protein